MLVVLVVLVEDLVDVEEKKVALVDDDDQEKVVVSNLDWRDLEVVLVRVLIWYFDVKEEQEKLVPKLIALVGWWNLVLEVVLMRKLHACG